MNGNLNANWPGGLTVPTQNYPSLPDNSITMPNGVVSVGVNPMTWFGNGGGSGGGIQNLLPALICDPRHHASGLYFNPNCFGPPAYGQQGAFNWPYVKGPAYFDSDLALFKNFQITERQKFQLRISAVNFLNHPLPQFGLAGLGDEQLNFDKAVQTQVLNVSTGNTDTVTVHSLSPTNVNTTTTGKPAFKTGSRTLTFALKYYF